MKKKILVIMESLRIGGAEKSLLTILSMFDYTKYDVDLFLFNHNGEFMEFLPKEVNLLNKSENYDIFQESRKLAPFKFLLKLDFKRTYHSFMYLVKCLYYKITRKLYIGWEHVQYMFDNIEKEYDTSIAFLERKTIYFNVDKVKSKNKIGFIHNDYSTYAYDYKNDKKYFANYNKIATVSEHCKEVLEEIFPEYKDKFLVIKNMVSKNMINKMAEEKLDIEKGDFINIVSVGRLVEQKGFDIALEVCKLLVDDGLDIKWYIIGCGPQEENLRKQIIKNNLQDKFILVGAQKNPYKWMKFADIYVQSSRFEGYGITVAEAKTLGKFIVTSDIPEFREQLEKYPNKCIAKNEKMMYNYVKYIIESGDYLKNIKNEIDDNTNELEKLYDIMEEK